MSSTPHTKERESLSENKSVTDISNGSPQIDAQVAEQASRDIHGWKWALVVPAILSSTFLFALDATIVADIQAIIVLHFNDVGKISWLSVAFLASAASTILIWGKVYGVFNTKRTYILCVVLFEVGSAVCGAAPSLNSLIVGRAICGVGGAGMWVGVITLLSVTTTIRERPNYLGLTGFVWGVGTVLGPIIGGAFSDSSVGWRWSFYINLCVGAAFGPVLLLIPNKDPRPDLKFIDKAREMDPAGGLLAIGAFLSGIMAISFGGIIYPWNSGQIIGLFVCSGVLFIILGIQQAFAIFTTTSRRIFPTELLRSRTMLILFVAMAAVTTATFIPIYFVPLFFQFTKSDTGLEAGVRLLPYLFLLVFSIIGSGAFLSMHGMYMPLYLVGGILGVVGSALMYTVDENTKVANVYGYTIIVGFANGLYFQTSFGVAQALVTPQMTAAAVGFITCAQIGGGTIGLAMANTIFLNHSQNSLQKILPNVPLKEIQSAIAGAGSSFVSSLTEMDQALVLQAIVRGIQKTYILVMVATALATILSLAMKRERLFVSPRTIA